MAAISWGAAIGYVFGVSVTLITATAVTTSWED
jgi:hypothetical protein